MNTDSGIGPASEYLGQDAGAIGLDHDRVAVFGHSYASRLARAEQGSNSYETPGGVWRNYQFSYFGVPGAKVRDLKTSSQWGKLVLFRPRTIFLLIGGNDIKPGCSPRKLAIEIKNLALELEDASGAECRIVGLECRTRVRGFDAEEFHRIRNAVNCILRKLPESKHRFVFITYLPCDLDNDGVHLRVSANQELYNKLAGLLQKLYTREARVIRFKIPSSCQDPIIIPH